MAGLHGTKPQQLLTIVGQQGSEPPEVAIRQALPHDHHGVDAAVGMAVGLTGVALARVGVAHATPPTATRRIGWLNWRSSNPANRHCKPSLRRGRPSAPAALMARKVSTI